MSAAIQSLHYNTTQALIVWTRTEWSLQGFEMLCSIVWCLYDSVISNECKSFKAKFADPRSLHTSQLIWLETPYGHAGYPWESLHQSDGNKKHWDEMYMFQLTISIALNTIPESNASGPCHAMTVTIITFWHINTVMFKGYGDEHHPMVEEWRTGYGYEVRGNC